MKAFKFYLRTLFGFSAREVNGFIVLASIMLVSLTIPPVCDQFVPVELPAEKPAEIFKSDFLPEKLFAFDPNHASKEEFEALGFTKQLAARIEKFRNAGGKFFRPTDLLKVYGMDSVLYERIKDSVLIHDQYVPPFTRKTYENREHVDASSNKKTYPGKSFSAKLLDINACDSVQLETLRGIGPALASRIIKYRQKLGGFVDTTQFKEVYGLKDFSLEELKRTTFISKNFIPQKIRINEATQEVLGMHPYIGWKAARIIANWRKQHGMIKEERQLVEINTMVNIPRLRPYIEYQKE